KELVEKLPIIDKRERTISDLNIDSKGLDHYNIYRNDQLIGTSTTTNFIDALPPVGLNEYYITAYYINPMGESDPSNSIFMEGYWGPYSPNISIIKNDSTYALWWEYGPNYSYLFRIFSSDDPYGEFVQVDSLWSPNVWDTFEWEIPMNENKKFYQVVVDQGDKRELKIKVKESSFDR
ncbi:MAG: hypothetical protein GQ534_04260, partial [Candidatus Delongbacteria bacterium]|nr:hypothetical protein [Candidatus Delongbacteria bacterium]